MRRSQRLIAASVLVALATVLAGCSSSMTNFDPSDLLDFLDTKKKLPGDRKPVFPDGVPGLEQGVPKELYKGSAQQQLDQQNAPPTAVAAAPLPEEPKPAKSKGKTRPPATATLPDQGGGTAADGEPAAAEDGSTPAVPQPPKPKKIVRRRTTAPPPDQTAEQPAAAGAQPQGTPPPPQQAAQPFPAPMPSGTFTR